MAYFKWVKRLVLIVAMLLILICFYNIFKANISGVFLSKITVENQPLKKDAEHVKEEPNIGQATDTGYEYIKPQEMEDIEIIFGGDVMMDSYIGDYIKSSGPDYPWEEISPLLKSADLSLVNLETSISRRGFTKKPEGFGFRSTPESLEGLKNAGINLVSIANNHVYDFGKEAFLDTLMHLDERDIAHVGGGENLAEAEEPVILKLKDMSVGIVAYTSIIPWDNWKANENNCGVAPMKPEDYDRILENIERASRQCDMLVVLLHWGTEYENTPDEWQIDLAHSMIDKGADVIAGHHPHVLQGIELYKNKPILYSTGNLIFLKKNELAGKTGLIKLRFNRDGFNGGSFYPINIKYCKANLLPPSEKAGSEIIDMLRDLSLDMGTYIDEKGNIIVE